MFKKVAFVCIFLGLNSALAQSNIVPFKELTGKDIIAWTSSNSDVIMEFRAGDNIPLQLFVTSDFFNLKNNSEDIPLVVKKTFYIKKTSSGFLISIDGNSFKPLKESITGNIGFTALSPAENLPIDCLKLNLDIKQRE